MSDCFTSNNEEFTKQNSGLCACKRADRRPGQGDCARCHALSNVAYRARKAIERRTAAKRQLAEMVRKIIPPIGGVSNDKNNNPTTG